MSSEKNVVQACYGRIQVPNGASAQLYIFGMQHSKSLPIDKVASVTALTKPTVTAALAGFKYDVVGMMNSNNFTMEDNTFVVLKGRRSLDLNKSGGIQCAAELYLRMRKDAPYYSITMDLPSHPNALHQKMRFVGRFDVLSVDEAEALRLIMPNSGLSVKLRAQTDTATKRVFDLTMLADSIVQKPSVSTISDGETDLIITDKTRSINLD